MSIFNAAGGFVRSFQLPAIDDRIFPWPRGGVFADGSVLTYTERTGEPGTIIRERGIFTE